MTGQRRGYAVQALASAVVLVVGLVCFAADRHGGSMRGEQIGGPYARLLAGSTDLGPARTDLVELVATLHQPSPPVQLDAWARTQGLSVRWRDGDGWAVIEGAPAAVARAFGVTVHDYRTRGGPHAGQVFYASPQQPGIPATARSEVSGVGRILDYLPYRETVPPTPPLDVPDGGLLPDQLLSAYNVTPLTQQGYTGKGQTVVVFGFDGFLQQDMDSFAAWFHLPPFVPEVVGGMPQRRGGEANMDLQVIHAVAPDAKLVLVNARPSVESGGGFLSLAKLLESVDHQYPGAIWSFSIGWGCDRLFTAADLAPVRAALVAALRRGTSAFIATGDLAGLECKGGHNWADPPSPDDVGVDAVGSIPEITAVGGTRLSTDADGRWLAEQSWYDVPLTQGTAGGVSELYARPSWQTVDPGAGPPGKRLVPDISAVADPNTGVKIVFNQQVQVGGGTSQSAPIWAGMAAVINERLSAIGDKPLGDINPVLYKVAQGSRLPAFHDIRLGGNAISTGSLTGFDMVTGLGTPNVENLVKAILLARSAGR
ncbi:S53 family peptidase [Mycobacterium sp. CVI_P3]|uniref:S53 family peptidase n=1 Tax=Mycobacterium pinniadriaticum TaxID=2994102 RepID=A0ABT3S9G5_9MYCO|nr:S53 family peptidase [Mycobacterium pinniadriaticum]MCX2929360.1 S53 family peptidase [Mycobacterium pinniadriaticum]MCX2935784.1 S53 family peptidase [Mycobacterium pinniadriaticum]